MRLLRRIFLPQRAQRTQSFVASVISVISVASFCLAAGDAPKRKWRDVPMPPLRQYTAPKPEVVTLKNGVAVYLMEDHELPTIDLVALVRTGSVFEPRDKAGLAGICGEVMRSGGTERQTGDELDQVLEDMAASVEVGIGPSEGRASLSCLRESFGRTLPILMDVLERPAFRQDKLDMAKKQAKSGIARRNDDPSGIARREYSRVMYGDESPYGWTTELATIDAITREDLVEFHKDFFAEPKRTIVGVVGDFDAKEMKALLEATFGKWRAMRGDRHLAWAMPEVKGDGPAPGKVWFARKTDVNQTTIVMGHLGLQRKADDPDHAATIVANDILGGGGFAARLLQRVRTEMGLAYGVYSSWNAPYSHRGTFTLTCQTKSESTVQATEAMRKELEKIIAEPVTADELRVAKESIQQQLIFESETRAEVLQRALRYAYWGFPQDYLEKFQAAVAKVTAEDVARVAKARFHPENLVLVVVGNDKEFGAPLAKLGEVKELDIETPAWPKKGASAAGEAKRVAEAAPSAEAIEKGRALIAKAIEAKGGREALERVKSIRQRGGGTITTPQGALPVEVDLLVVFPDKTRMEMKLPIGKVVRALDGEKGWVQAPMGVMDMQQSEAKDMREQVEKDEVPLLLQLAKPDAKPVWLGKETLDEEELDVVSVGDGTKLYFEGGARLVRRSRKTPRGESTSVWSDFRDVGGVMLPFAARALLDGEEAFKFTASAIEVNVEVAADAFARPQGNDMQPGRRTRGPGTAPAGAPKGEGVEEKKTDGAEPQEAEPKKAAGGGN